MSASYENISARVPVAEKDYLDEDPVIRGQNYVVLSFISPEEVIKQKEVVFFNKYIASFSEEMNKLLNNLALKDAENKAMIDVIRENFAYIFDQSELQEQFNYYKATNSESLEKDYLKENDFQTSIRGVKVRGAYDSLEEAENRIKFLKRNGCRFPIYAASMGCWLPWSPNPDEIADAKYAETTLNSIAMKLKENTANREKFFNERKEKNTEYVKDDTMPDPFGEEKPRDSETETAAVTETVGEINLDSQPTLSEYDKLREDMKKSMA